MLVIICVIVDIVDIDLRGSWIVVLFTVMVVFIICEQENGRPWDTMRKCGRPVRFCVFCAVWVLFTGGLAYLRWFWCRKMRGYSFASKYHLVIFALNLTLRIF